MPQVYWAVYVMVYPNVCECGTVSHDVCEIMGGSITVYADFVDGVINPFTVPGQCKVVPATKPAEVRLVLVW